MIRTSCTVLLAALAAAAGAQAPAAKKPAAPSLWLQDYELARSQARARNCDLLLAMLGPADDADSKRLEQEVLSKPEFAKAATKLFVLMRCDVPKDEAAMSAEQRQLLGKLRQKYPTDTLPMLWLTDGMGTPYAKCGYLPGGADACVAVLDGKRQQVQQARELLTKAAALRGMERAETLADAFRHLDDDIVATTCYREMLEVIGADANGKAGLRDEFDAVARDGAARMTRLRLQRELEPLLQQKDWAALAPKLEALQQQHAGERWAEQYSLYLQGCRHLDAGGDAAEALSLLTRAHALAERSELAPWVELRRRDAAAAVEKQQREEAARSKAPPPGGPGKKK